MTGEHPAPAFVAREWFTITGRGPVAVVDPPAGFRDAKDLVGDHVSIDGQPYRVRGVETLLPAGGHPKGRPIGLLVGETGEAHP